MEGSPIDRIRTICLALPEAGEKPAGLHAAFTIRGKTFVYYLDNHHGDGKLALCCRAGPGGQEILVGADPERFFVPAYLGHRGWVSLRLDRPFAWDEVEGLIVESYRLIGPKKLVSLLDVATRGGHPTSPNDRTREG